MTGRRNPTQRLRFGKEPRQNEREVTLIKSRRERYGVRGDVEQVKGIEPSCSAWEADILPLNYTCKLSESFFTITHRGLICKGKFRKKPFTVQRGHIYLLSAYLLAKRSNCRR